MLPDQHFRFRNGAPKFAAPAIASSWGGVIRFSREFFPVRKLRSTV
jgi:hypothetical protein